MDVRSIVFVTLFCFVCRNVSRMNAPFHGALDTLDHGPLDADATRSSSQLLTRKAPRFAYAFVVAGCDPEQPESYRPFLYNIMIASKLLHQMGSVADIVAFVQIRHHSLHQTLPDEDIRHLRQANITRVLYIPKTKHESYFRTQFDKFRILNLTEYERVIYLDADVIPMSKLDYLFELSMNGQLKENLAIAGRFAPANGGIFMLKPGPKELDRVNEIIAERFRLGQGKKGSFDLDQGWGESIEPSDAWEARFGQRGSKWNFYAAWADQGLLYHWVKYEKKSVSIVIDDKLESWGEDMTGLLVRERVDHGVLLNYSNPLHCFKACDLAVYRDTCHYGWKRKPWLYPPPSSIHENNLSARTKSARDFWYHALYDLNEELSLGIVFKNWSKAFPPFGLTPKKRQVGEEPFAL